MAKQKRTKKKYNDLFDNPELIFKDCELIIFPNGQDEIWIKEKNGTGKGFRISASRGKYGIRLSISSFIGTGNFNVFPYYAEEKDSFSDNMISLCHYDDNEKALEYKKHYIQGNIDDFYKKYPEELK